MQYASSLVFKQYKPEIARALDVRVLESMPAYLESLTFAEGMELLSLTAWPCRLVEEQGAVAGFVMPKIPDAFFLQMKKSSGTSRELAEFQHLLNDESFLARRGINVSDRDRYELLREVAQALLVFHRHGIAVGDLSPKNLLFTCGQAPGAYFVDCDAMRFQGRSVMPQLETPGWEIRAASANEELGTAASDSYKFGLLALRLLAGTQDGRDPDRLPPAVPAEIRKLVTASLSVDPAKRPKPADWIAALRTAARTASAKPPQATTSTTLPQAIMTTATPSVNVARTPAGQSAARTPARHSAVSTGTSSTPAARPRRRSRGRVLVISVISLLVVGGGAFAAFQTLFKQAPPFSQHGSSNYVAVSADGKFIYSAAGDTIYTRSIATKRVTATHSGLQVTSLAANRAGEVLVTPDSSDAAAVWNVATGRTVTAIAGAAVNTCVALSPDGKTLATCNNDGDSISLWSAARKRVTATLHILKTSDAGSVSSDAFSPNGKTLAVSINAYGGYSTLPGVEFLDISTGRVTAKLPYTDGGGPIYYSHDGSTFITADEFGNFYLFNAGSKPKRKVELSDPSSSVSNYTSVGSYPVAYSPDDKTAATADSSPTDSAYLWDLATGQLIATLTDPESGGVTDLAYTPDGKTLAVADGNGNIYLWNVTTHRIIATFIKPSK